MCADRRVVTALERAGVCEVISIPNWKKRMIMKFGVVFLVTILSLGASAAHAKGCLKGAVVGGVAGHYAGHHGVLGAAAGCVVGRHEAKKHERERIQEQKNREFRNGEEK